MQIMMVILLTIITIDRGEKKKKQRKNTRLASDDAGIDAGIAGCWITAPQFLKKEYIHTSTPKVNSS